MSEGWGSRITFIIAASGSAVGLGNIWKFPYMVGNNGGFAFLIMYLIMVFGLGFSVMMAEFTIGSLGHSSDGKERNFVSAIKTFSKKWSFLGYGGMIAAFILAAFYAPVAGWALKYTVWCIQGFISVENREEYSNMFNNFLTMKDHTISNTNFIYTISIMLISLLAVQFGVKRGIGFLNDILMPLLLILILVLVIRAVTLPNAIKGIKYYLLPHFEENSNWYDIFLTLKAASVDALTHAFFSLSLGYGVMVTYAAYSDNKNRLVSAAFWVVILDTTIAFLAGLMIFPSALSFDITPSIGPSLVFVTMPKLFSMIPFGGLFAFLFFLALTFAALTSLVSLLEVPISFIYDTFKLGRKFTTWLVGISVTILSIFAILGYGDWSDVTIMGMPIGDFYDFLVESIGMPLGGALISIFVGWIITKELRSVLVDDYGNAYFWSEIVVWILRIFAPIICFYVVYAGVFPTIIKYINS